MAQLQKFNPLFHLHNGDLSYANSNQMSQPQVWEQYFDNTHPPVSLYVEAVQG